LAHRNVARVRGAALSDVDNTMNRTDRLTRRRFLRAAAAGGVAYAFGRTPGVTYAQMSGDGTLSDYRALVCVFLFGGNDSWNMVVPASDAEHAVYAGTRQNLAIAQDLLLPLHLAAPDASGWSFGLNPAMAGLADLFNSGRAAIVANVGPLIAPATLSAYQNGSVPLPPQLFSHNDQQDQWHSLKGKVVSKTGWAGRIADALSPRLSSQRLALNVSLSGQTLFQAGAAAVPYTMGAAGPAAFTGFPATGIGPARRQAFQSVAGTRYESLYERAFASTALRALQFGESVTAALATAPEFPSLPSSSSPALSGLATQLRTVARLIAARDQLAMSRQIFFVATGGFDTHDDQVDDQPTLLGTVSDALKRFDDAMQQLGISQKVTAFTQSDFGRTLTSNGDGTDHAWGGVQIVTGGAVAGGRIYGEYPLLKIGARRGTDRADDVGGGRFIPTVSSDQYAATLASWFGVPEADLRTIAPSIDNFTARTLGFLI
jgi:uncharacterized protein (DUF1501 family)